jgi:hypothetical protein
MFIFLFSFFFAQAFAVIEAPKAGINFEQNPSHLVWKKIDSEHFEVIFPAEVEEEAQRVTHLLEVAYPLVTRSLEVAPPKISLILQNQSTVSNGFVTLAPRRSEWYLTPAIDPELSNTEWLKTLAVHEFRHVVQFQKTRQHFNKVFEYILGEIGQALGLGLTLPPWYLEGDAVGIETALTKGGRGRLPMFERDLKALLLSDQDFDYDKAHLGSFKHYIPNHYLYGYFYTTFMRNRHGDLFLSKLANRSTTGTYNPLTFYNSYEAMTGEEFEEFYRSTMKELIKNWKEKEAQLSLTPYAVQNLKQKYGWTNYLYPQMLENGKFLALKKGLSHIEQFVITDGKKDQVLFYPGPLQNEYPYKIRNNRLVFSEWEVDPRWGYRDFSRIRVYDLKKNKFVADLRNTKGRLAQLDHKGEFILYVDWSETQGQRIVVRDLKGEEMISFPYPKDKVITSLDWIDSQNMVMVLKDHEDQKQVVALSLTTLKETTLLPKSTTNLGFIATHERRILVESPLSGIDNIFEVRDQMLVQLTTSRFGAYAPSVNDEKLVYSDYSALGMNIATKKLIWDEPQPSQGSFVPYYEKLSTFEGQGKLDENIFQKSRYPVSSYSQLKKSVNLHSWVLLAPPLSNTLTVMGLSRDVLNKFTLTAGSTYHLDEQEIEGFVSTAWSHYYPVFDLRAGYGGRNQNVKVGNKEIEDHWEEGTFEAGASIPWQKVSGRFFHSFTARAFAKLIKVTNKVNTDSTDVSNGALFSPGTELMYSFTSRTARRDINPEWGIMLSSRSEEGTDITGKDMTGSLYSGDGRLFLPGIFKHHSFYHQFAYEKQRDDSYQYASTVAKPRGTRNVFLEELRKYSGNYLFPLAYPDWHLSRYVYFKRVALNLFYDEINGHYRGFNYHGASAGWEALVDTHFFRIFIPITLGVRGSYPIHGMEKDTNYEVFITTLGGYF